MRDRHLPQAGQHGLHAAQGMVGHVQAQHLALEVELGLLVPFLHVRHGDTGIAHVLGIATVDIGEQVELPLRLLALEPDHRVDGRLVDLVQRPAVRVDGVEGTGLDQGFDQTPVQRAQRHTTNEVHEVHELAPRTAAFGDDIGHRLIADVTDCAQAETDDVADGGVLQYRFVHIGRQHLDAHTPGLAQIQRRLVLVRAFVLQQGRHELHRIVGLQIRGPVGDQTVCGGMRFVERVPGERHEDVPDGLGRLLGIAVFLHTGEERHLLLGQHLGLLLAHGSAQHVGSAERVASQDTRGRLHLLLIHDQAIGLVQHGGQRLGHLRVDRGDLLQAVLTLGVVVVRIDIHRARSV